MASPIVEGFSLSHAAILDPETAAQATDPDNELYRNWGDIYGIRSGALDVDTDSYDNTGDDAVLSSWFWFNFANVTVQSGYIPFTTIARLSNAEVATRTLAADSPEVSDNGEAAGDYYSIPLWNEKSLNTPTRPMLIRVPSKDKNGLVRELDFVLYKVQFQPFGFDGPAYKDGLLLNYSGRALMSDTDHAGNVLAERSIGRLISKPVA